MAQQGSVLLETWMVLAREMVAGEPGVTRGKMMSADALTYSGKVFAFFSTKGGRVGLGCRLGRDYDIERLDLKDWQHLAPFKTKPPMKDWIVAGEGDRLRWPDLLQTSLRLARQRKA